MDTQSLLDVPPDTGSVVDIPVPAGRSDLDERDSITVVEAPQGSFAVSYLRC